MPNSTTSSTKSVGKPSFFSKFRRKLSAFLLISLTAILCLLAVIYSSPWGAQITVKIVNKLTPLSFEYKDGLLSEGVNFTSLHYSNEHVDMRADNITLKFHLRCLLKEKLCIDSLSAQTLNINVHPKPSSEDTTPKQLELPFAINADEFSINLATINVSNKTIIVEDFHSQVDIKNNYFGFKYPTATNVTYQQNSDLNVQQISSPEQKTAPKIIDALKNLHTLQLPELYLPINLHINHLTLDSFLIKSTAEKEDKLVIKNSKLNGKWNANSISISSFAASHKAIEILRLQGTLETHQDYLVNVGIKTKIKQNTIWPQIENSIQSTSFQGDLSSLRFTGSSQGSLDLTTNGTIALRVPELPYSITMNAKKLPLYDDLSNVVQPSTFALRSEGNLAHQNLTIDSVVNGLGYNDAKLHFQGQHSSNNNTSKNDSSNNKTQLEIASFTLVDAENDIDVSGNVSLADNPAWNLQITADKFTLPKIEQPILGYKLTGHISGLLNTHGVFKGKNSEVSIKNSNISGVLNNVPFSAVGNLDLGENLHLSQSNLSVSLYDSTVKLSGFNNTHWHVNGSINTPEINAHAPEVNGKLATTFSVEGPLNNPRIHFEHNVDNFKYKDFSSLFIQTKGVYEPLNNHAITAEVTSNKVIGFEHEFNDVISHINANINTQKIDLSWQGDLNSKLQIEGKWNTQSKHWTGKVESAEINYLDFQWLPNKKIIAEYNHRKKAISVSEHCWENEGLNLCLTEDVSFFKQGNIPLYLSMYTPIFNETFSPEDILINTNIDGTINLAWKRNSDYTLTGDLSFLAGNILLEDTKLGLPIEILSAWDKGKFTFDINKESVKSQLSLSPNEGNTAHFYSTLSIDSAIKRGGDFPILGTASLHNFNLRPFQSISPEISSLSGVVQSDIKLGGTLKTPNIKGKVSLYDASVNFLRSPTVFDQGNVTIDLLGTDAKIIGSFNVDDDIASINGDANWLHERWLNVDVAAEQLSVMVPPHVKATVAPQLNVKLTEDVLRFTGDVHVLDGILEVNKLPEGSVELSKDVIFVDTQGNEIVKESRFDIESSIRLFIDDEFQLSGQGFNGNLEGSLLIEHGTRQPLQVFGNLNVPGGRYHAYGQRLQIEKGKVAFNGPTDNPHVDLRATRTIPKESIKVGVEITGLANALTLNLISTPSMTRAQTLSYLLRGQPLDLDNPDNSGVGVALGAALANYSGILKQIEKLPLLNNVEIEGSSEQISIAGYIGKKIYLKYGIGVEEPVNELTVRLFLLSRLWLETISRAASERENSIDLYYSFDTNL